MDAAQWSQQLAILPRPMEETTTINSPINNLSNTIVASKQQQQQQQQQQQALERKTRPQKEQNLNCPRCNSTNTKFCYYNNYSLTQPRYFCKTCRRYWTKGGSLRSVPVGGGSRKNKRSSNSSILTSLPPPPQLQSPSTTTTQSPMLNKLLVPDLNPPTSLSHLLNSSHQNPNNIKFLEAHDLNLAFPIQGLFNHHIDHQFPKMEGNNNNNNNENHEPSFNLNPNNSCPTITTTTTATTTTTTTTATTTAPISALELLRTGMASRGSLNPFSPMSISSDPSTLYQSGYPNLQDFKPNMMNIFASPSDHINNNNSNDNNNNNNLHDNNNVGGGARLLFPFADMNKLATNTTHTHHDDDHHHHHIDENDDQINKGNGDDDHHHHLNHNSSGFWNGMLGGGTW